MARGKHAARAARRREIHLAELRARYDAQLQQEQAAHTAAEESVMAEIEHLRANRDEIAQVLATRAVAVAEREAEAVEQAAKVRHDELIRDVLAVVHSDTYGDEPWRPAPSQAEAAAAALGVPVERILNREAS